MPASDFGALRVLVRFIRRIKQTWESTWDSYRQQEQFQTMVKARESVIESYLATHPVRKLQIGAGENPLEGWLNTDLEPLSSDVIFMDATQVFPYEDKIFDYVFSEHMIEHVPYKYGLVMLNEIYRVLRPGGRVRIATPDVIQIVGLYVENKSDVQRRYLEWNSREVLGLYSPAESRLQERRPEWNIGYEHIITFYPDGSNDSAGFVVNNMFRSYGHQFLYDQKTLQAALRSAGFSDIVQVLPDESPDINLRGIDSHERLIGKDMNRLETMVLEARRPLGSM